MAQREEEFLGRIINHQNFGFSYRIERCLVGNLIETSKDLSSCVDIFMIAINFLEMKWGVLIHWSIYFLFFYDILDKLI